MHQRNLTGCNGAAAGIFSLLVLLVMLTGVVPCEAQSPSEGYDGRRSAYWAFSWRAPEGGSGPRGLRLVDSGSAGFVTRLLVLDESQGWRLILTNTLDPRRGLTTTEIVDDTTGWWIRLEHMYEVRDETLSGFFGRGRELPSIDEATGLLEYRLITRSGWTFAPQIPARGATTSVIWDGLFEQLAARDLVRHIAGEVPDTFRAPVLFLDVSLMDWSSTMEPGAIADRARDWPGLLGLLARVLRAALPADDPRITKFAMPWTMVREGPSGKGSTLVEPELLELASRFRAVENADPLAGHRVDDLAASATDP